MTVRIWKGKLSLLTDASEDAMVPMASDVEPGEFTFMRDEPGSKLLHLTRVHSVTDVNVSMRGWGTTSKSASNGIYLRVQILDSSKLPALKPRKGKTTTPWQWDVPAESFDDLVVLRHVVVLASGKMGKATKRRLRSLDKSFTFRKYLS